MNPLKELRIKAAAAIRPDPIMTVSEWADAHRVLSQKGASEPGKWRTSRAPYLKEPMDCLSKHSLVREVVIIKGAQLGFTEMGNNWIGYSIDYAPGPMMMVLGSLDLAKSTSKQRISPMIEESPRLASKVKPSRSRDSGNTLLTKEFDNGILKIVGANSPVGLRSMPVEKLMLDELDSYPVDVKGEGDPVALAEARTRTFVRRKILKISTPTFEGRSKIAAAWEESDKRRYHIPCPMCGHMQWLKWSRIEWPKDKPQSAFYRCEGCEGEIQHHQKAKMMARGQWIAEKPGASNGAIAGFHISSLYSTLAYSWGDAAVEWLKAQGSHEKLRAFVNTVLGETWKEKGDAPEWQVLYNRREKYELGTVPEPVVFLTAGVDVQKDRLEVEIVGWTANKESYSVDYIVFYGETASIDSVVWEQLDELLARTFQQKVAGGQVEMMPISMLAIDSGANTQTVYNWSRRHSVTRVMCVKGQESAKTLVSQPTKVDVSVGGKKMRRGAQVWNVGINMIKSELYEWLNCQQPTNPEQDGYPAGYCHFPEYSEEYFKMLTAEQITVKMVRGFRKYQWEKIRERNESLDCRVYARAAASVLGLDRRTPEQWRKRGVTKVPESKKPVPAEQNKVFKRPKVAPPRKKVRESIW